MYYDLNVPIADGDLSRLRHVVKNAYEAGYHTIAINHTVTGKLSQKDVDYLKTTVANLGLGHIGRADASAPLRHMPESSLRLLSRITIVFDTLQQAQQFASMGALVKHFDLLAVQASDEKVFQYVATSFDCDLITFDYAQRIPFPMRFPLIKQALARNVLFEVSFGLALKEPSLRKDVFSNAAFVLRVTKGRGTVLTSGTIDPFHVRSPLEVMNLAVLFGLPSPAHGKKCLCERAEKAVGHAMMRGFYKGAVGVVSVSQLSEADLARIPASHVNVSTASAANTSSTDASSAKRGLPPGTKLHDEPSAKKRKTDTL